jgi:hypothetical protein
MEAPTKCVWNATSKIWNLSVKCPHCKVLVKHGGGDNPNEAILGSRACNKCSNPIKLIHRKKKE